MISPFPTNTRDIIETIINEIGRPVEFVQSTLSGCPTCALDPVSDTSTDSFCPTCSGEYWIPNYHSDFITAHVTWKYADYNNWSEGGYVFQGDGIAKIMYSGPYMDILDNTDYMVIDGKVVDVEHVKLLGVPSVNRIILDFKERHKDE